MAKRSISTFKIAATFIGTVVGAGFASGQEILQFFVVFGIRGLWGLVIATLLFILFGYIIMNLGMVLHAQSHLDIIQFSSGHYLGKIIDYIISFFLFGALTTMLAGAGAMFNQAFSISSLWGIMIMSIITTITVMSGINGIINSISAVVPFLLISAVGISIASFFIEPFDNGSIFSYTIGSNITGNWLWSAILYISYNMALSIAVLGTIGTEAKNNKSLLYGAILGGLGLGLGAAALFLAMSKNVNSIINIEVPLVYIASHISHTFQYAYSIVLLAEVYTTAVSNLYSITIRITDIHKSQAKFYILGITLLSFVASQFGFSNLVRYLYPLMGYAGIFLLVSLLYSQFINIKFGHIKK
jgi:uncharacterized membrane protein YkvI